jgi:hypothetical protein
VKQIKAGGRMVIDTPSSGLHDVPTEHARKVKGRAQNPGPSAIHIWSYAQSKSQAEEMARYNNVYKQTRSGFFVPGSFRARKVHGQWAVVGDKAGAQANPGPSAIPTRWTSATVSRKGGQIQIRMGRR